MELYTNDIVLMNDGKLYKYIATIEGVWNLVHLFIDENMNITRVKDHRFEEFIEDNIREVYKQPEATSNLKDFKYKIEIKEDFNLSDLVNNCRLVFRNGNSGHVYGADIFMKEFIVVSMNISSPFDYFMPLNSAQTTNLKLSDYMNDLRHRTIKAFDIMEVHLNHQLYERDEKWFSPITLPIKALRNDTDVKKEISKILQNRRANFPS